MSGVVDRTYVGKKLHYQITDELPNFSIFVTEHVRPRGWCQQRHSWVLERTQRENRNRCVTTSCRLRYQPNGVLDFVAEAHGILS